MLGRSGKHVIKADFIRDRQEQVRETLESNNLIMFRAFATPDGERALDILKQVVGGQLIATTTEQTIANAARRDLVDLIEISIQSGAKELNDG